MNAPAATQAEGGILTKPGTYPTDADPRTKFIQSLLTLPADWAYIMVTAALKYASDEKLAATYTSHDEAKHSILKTLNWYEAHDEYEWPDFSRLGFDFSQAMRLRRGLVQDVSNALEQAGNIKITIHGTPDSLAGGRQIRQPDGAGECAVRNSFCFN